MNDIFKRKGTFKIEDSLLFEQPDLVQKVLSKVLILRAEHMMLSRKTEYMAISKRFSEVEEGRVAPEYYVEIVNGFVSFKEKESREER